MQSTNEKWIQYKMGNSNYYQVKFFDQSNPEDYSCCFSQGVTQLIPFPHDGKSDPKMNSVSSLAFCSKVHRSSDKYARRKIACAFWNGKVMIYDIYTKEALFSQIEARKYAEISIKSQAPITHVEWIGEGERLLISSFMPTVYYIDLDQKTGPLSPYLKELFSLPENTGIQAPQGIIATYYRGNKLLSASYQGVIQFFKYSHDSLENPQLLHQVKASQSAQYFHASLQQAGVIWQDGTLSIYIESVSCFQMGHTHPIAIVGSTNGRCQVLATNQGDGKNNFLDPATGNRSVEVYALNGLTVDRNDATRLYTIGQDGQCIEWNYQNRTKVKSIAVNCGELPLTAVALSSGIENKLLAVAGGDDYSIPKDPSASVFGQSKNEKISVLHIQLI
ncbi:hypothetical protein FGO68_gene13877 [Halteria grandinella]|uniref:Uncharacterized protein n=1 Tax=Halteria grandinella TaxID=5974 RepID=A0A8J8NMP7_HALGN|nr:hypothetical protein FGO68_gene13877 [Halteria grandinella]